MKFKTNRDLYFIEREVINGKEISKTSMKVPADVDCWDLVDHFARFCLAVGYQPGSVGEALLSVGEEYEDLTTTSGE